MICQNLILSKKNNCFNEIEGVYQQIVFIKKDDLLSFEVESFLDSSIQGIEPIAYHRIKFKLREGRKGIRFQLNESSSLISANFSKTEKNKSPRYTHNISFGNFGVSERNKWILKQFDNSSDYFAVIQHKSNVIEVYGFYNGFKTENYEYASSSVIDLTSVFPEKEPPLVYVSESDGKEVEDFDKDFDLSTKYLKDFNNDFNNDFN